MTTGSGDTTGDGAPTTDLESSRRSVLKAVGMGSLVALGTGSTTAAASSSSTEPASRHLQEDAVAAEERLRSIESGEDPDEVYAAWNEFARTHFGAETDELIYERFGDSLELMGEESDDGRDSMWTHVSESSAAVSFETNLPAESHVEYRAEGSDEFQRTDARERPFYLHIHHVTGLEPGTTYEWRPVATDERGNELTGEVRTFRTRVEGAFTHLSPPDADETLLIDEPGEYLLTGDIDANRTAIEIDADDVTLDLGGHTVVYAQEVIEDQEEHFPDPWYGYTSDGLYGVRSLFNANVTLVNGRIVQGDTPPDKNRGNWEAIGFSPALIRGGANHELGGVELDYHSPQNTGVRFRGADENVHVHHNLVRDRGTEIDNRHGYGGPRAISFVSAGDNHVLNHNLVARTRQVGVSSALPAYNNEIYCDSWATNSFMMQTGNGEVAPPAGEGYHDNRLFATGYNPWGFGWAEENLYIHDNFFSLFGLDVEHRWYEDWGDVNLGAAFRITNYGDGGDERNNLEYRDNLVIARGKGGSKVRGSRLMSDTTISDVVFRDNVVKAEAVDEDTTNVGAVVTHGQYQKESALPIHYKNNHLMSNVAIVRFGADYAVGHNHNFTENTFERIGDRSDFNTFVFDGSWWSYDHSLRMNEYVGETSPDDVYWEETGWQSTYAVEWPLEIRATPNMEIAITDSDGEEVYSTKTGPGGNPKMHLKEYAVRPTEWSPDGGEEIEAKDEHQKIDRTPHTVTVSYGDTEFSEEVEMTEPRELRITPSGIRQI